MNYQEPYKITNIDFNKIVYPKHKANQNKKIILIKYNEKGKLKNFVFQTPTLFNLTKPQSTNGFAEIEVALTGKEKSKVSKFIKFLNDLENKIKSDAQFNASSWFNITSENQTINFQKIIRESDDYTNGTIKIKIIKNNDFETLLQLNNNKRINLNDVPEDSWCKMILECYAVWINSNNDFGIFFRPVLVSFTPKEKEVYNYNFVEDSEDEHEFDIPDTEVNNNIFMKVNSTNNKLKNNDSTSQLELNDLVKQLESDEQKRTSDINLSILTNLNKEKVLEINVENKYFSDSDSDCESFSDCDSNSDLNTDIKNKSSSPNIDAETSDD